MVARCSGGCPGAKALSIIWKRGGVTLFRGESIPHIRAELGLLNFGKAQSHGDGF